MVHISSSRTRRSVANADGDENPSSTKTATMENRESGRHSFITPRKSSIFRRSESSSNILNDSSSTGAESGTSPPAMEEIIIDMIPAALLGLSLGARYNDGPSADEQRGAVVTGFTSSMGDNQDEKRAIERRDGRVQVGDILYAFQDTDIVQDLAYHKIMSKVREVASSQDSMRIIFHRETSCRGTDGRHWPKTKRLSNVFFRTSSHSLSPSKQDSPADDASTSVQESMTFNQKLTYFKGFFAQKLPTGGIAPHSTKGIMATVLPEPPANDVVNDMYRDLLIQRGVPDDVRSELQRIEPTKEKWRHIWAAQQQRKASSHPSNNHLDENRWRTNSAASAMKVAEQLVVLKWDLKGLKTLESLCTLLSYETPEWTSKFIDSFGLDYLTMKLPDPSPFAIEYISNSSSGKNASCSPSQFCRLVLRALRQLSHFSDGIESIVQTPGLIFRTLLCFHTENIELKTEILQLCGMICYSSAAGHGAVLNGFDEYKQVKGEKLRFTTLSDTLKSTRYSLPLKEDVLSFVNILVNKALRLEDRVSIRTDFIHLGVADYFEDIRNKSSRVYDHQEYRSSLRPEVEEDEGPEEKTSPPLSLPLSSPPTNQTNHHEDDDGHDNQMENDLVIVDEPQKQQSFQQLRGQLDNIERQIEVFETFMEDDRKDTIHDQTDLSSVTSVFDKLTQQAVDEEVKDCFLSILQHLLFIPTDFAVGKELWALCNRMIREITLLASSADEIDAFTMSFDDRKNLLRLRDSFSAYMKRGGGTDEGEQKFISAGIFTPYTIGPIQFVVQERRIVDEREMLLDSDTSSSCGSSSSNSPKRTCASIVQTDSSPQCQSYKSDPEYDKYFKLLKLGMPLEQLQLRMKAEGKDPSALVDDPQVSLAEQESKVKEEKLQSPPEIDHSATIQYDPDYAKYFKLLKMGMPMEQVKLKIEMEGLDASFLETPDTPRIKVKDDPDYIKYFKLIKMGMPKEQVAFKMTVSGFNSALLDTPDAFVPLSKKKKGKSTIPFALKRKTEAPVGPKLRNLYWERVTEHEGTIWASMTDTVGDRHADMMIPMDIELLQERFTNSPGVVKKKDSDRKVQHATTRDRKKRISLIDMKRANNIGIMLARFRMPYAQIRAAVLQVDATILSMEKLQAMIQFAPLEDEIHAIKNYTGDVQLLGEVEQYFFHILSIPRYGPRVQCILSAWQFNSNVQEQRRLLSSVVQACAQLKASMKFRHILRLILDIGNELNRDSSRGQARGFELDILVKLGQVKARQDSSASKFTLLHYVAQMIRRANAGLFKTFEEDLSSVSEASLVSIPLIHAGLNTIQHTSHLIAHEVKEHTPVVTNDEEKDLFLEKIEPFVEHTRDMSERIELEVEQMKATYDQCLAEFRGKTLLSRDALVGPNEFFSTIHSFGLMLRSADRENEHLRLAEARRLRLKEETERRLKKAQSQSPTSMMFKQGHADDIVKRIRSKRSQERRQEILETPMEEQPFSSSVSRLRKSSTDSRSSSVLSLHADLTTPGPEG